MQSSHIFVTIVSLGAFAMIFAIFYLRTRENMALIDRGINPKQFTNRPAPYRNLKNGLLFFGAGLGLLVAYFIDRNMPESNRYDNDNPAIYFACIAIGGGLGLIRSYAIEKREVLHHRPDGDRRDEPTGRTDS